MKAAIMQPYFFPYIGYWQLLNEVDVFVIYDDVNYIKRGWINRNRILSNGKAEFITLPLKGASQNKKINQIEIYADQRELNKIKRKIELAYHKAPYFEQCYQAISAILNYEEKNLARYLLKQLNVMMSFLNIDTTVMLSSELEKDNAKKGENKILEICKLIGADIYINPIGGVDLYNKRLFAQNQISLYFLKTAPFQYQQYNEKFIPDLSIIDIIMFNKAEEMKHLLQQFELQ